MAASVFTFVILLVLPYSTTAFATGPPDSACSNGTPQHVTSRNTNQLPQQNGCPYLVYFDFDGFTPGESNTLTITSWSGEDEFKGYMLLVLDENNESVGEFGVDHRTICSGAAVTHSNSNNKLFENISWIAPVDSSNHTYYIWLTVVRSYNVFWVNCDPVSMPANDVILNTTTGADEFVTDANGDPLGFTWPPSLPEWTTTPSETTTSTTTTTEEKANITDTPENGKSDSDDINKPPPSLSNAKPTQKNKITTATPSHPQNSESLTGNAASSCCIQYYLSLIMLSIIFILC